MQSLSVINLAATRRVAWVIFYRIKAFSKVVAIFVLQAELMYHLEDFPCEFELVFNLDRLD